MARRAPKDERPFNPIESALVERVSSRVAPQDRLVVAPDPVTERPEADESFERQPQQAKRPAREKRVLLSWEEEIALQRLLDQLTQTLQTPVKLSNALRSCLILLRHAQAPIYQHAARQKALVRPANNDQTGIALFEQRLAGIFQAGISATEKIDV